MKVGAAVVSARRGGNTASFDVLNKYFTISAMPMRRAHTGIWSTAFSDDIRRRTLRVFRQ